MVGLATGELSTVQQLPAYVVFERLLIQLNVSYKNVEYKYFTLIYFYLFVIYPDLLLFTLTYPDSP